MAGDSAGVATGREAAEDGSPTSPEAGDLKRRSGTGDELGRPFRAGYIATTFLLGARLEDSAADSLDGRTRDGQTAQDLGADGDQFGARVIQKKLLDLPRNRNRAAVPAARLAQ